MMTITKENKVLTSMDEETKHRVQSEGGKTTHKGDNKDHNDDKDKK